MAGGLKVNEQLSLLAGSPPAEPARKAPNFLELQAREKLKMPPEWKAFLFECLPEQGPTQVFKVEGSIPGVHARGKRKGEPDYRNGEKRATAYITIEEDRTWCKAWHIANNACVKCHGEGRRFVSASREEVTYRPCLACGEKGPYQGQEP
jgi:hypothetical protein